MTDPTPLSATAQAVLTAQAKQRCLFEWSTVNDPPCHPSDPEWNGCGTCVDRRGLAAALRAAADQMSAHHSKTFLYSIADYLKLQSIAAELDGTLPTSESD